MGSHDAHGKETGTANVAIEGLHLAATPTFALMAWLGGAAGADSMTMLCPVAHAMSPLGGMTAMYLLMAAFHASPWVRLASRGWRSAMRRGAPR